ncbi:MAG: nucleotide pyrophosphohydrolase [Wenzhouxiangella sp.]|nr:nucleotide pyrophosphohydrolase [Wenzhouxiangella sp.]MCH8479144.1 nucleotide pyrophosphohydrolase [Wenzhouxiangella sp.]
MPEWPELKKFQAEFRAFVAERDWDQFHSPKNLAMALAGEVGELLEHFQWLTEAQSRALAPEELEAVAMEVADVQIYLAALSDRLGIDIGSAVERKMALNAKKYPPDQSRGSAAKYTAYKAKPDQTGNGGKEQT